MVLELYSSLLEIVMVRVEVPVAPVGWLPALARAHSVAKAGPPPQPWLRE